MIRKIALAAAIIATCSTSAFADPILSVIPQGLQGGNWVWEVDITPDLVQAGGHTPLAAELGFRLTGDPLVSVTNLSPLIFDSNNPGLTIFGWEIPYSDGNNHPEGIEANCTGCSIANLALGGGHAATVVPGTTNEIFSALGSINVAVPGAIPYLQIVAKGPGNGGPSTSTIQWLGAYILQGQIAQLVGNFPQGFFYSGTASQSVPEPASVALFSCAALGFMAMSNRRPARTRLG
jgi:hypothetical protein